MLGFTAANSRPVVEKKIFQTNKTIHLDPHHITSKLNTIPTTWALCFTVLVVNSLVLS